MVSHDPHREWKTLGEEPVVRTPWFEMGLADVELPDGRRIDHYLFRVPPVVLTALQDDQDRVLLILRYRFIPGTWGWELPSGLADPAEDFAAAAARETLKETGWEPESPELLVRLEASAGLTDSVHHVYLASRATRRGEPGYETVRMEWFALADMPAMIASGEIRAASTSAAVLMIGVDDPVSGPRSTAPGSQPPVDHQGLDRRAPRAQRLDTIVQPTSGGQSCGPAL